MLVGWVRPLIRGLAVYDNRGAEASAYDLFHRSRLEASAAALGEVMPLFAAANDTILDVGAGSGSSVVHILESLPEARVVALESDASMRSLLLAKIAARPDLWSRVTLRPEDLFSAPLPASLGGAVLCGVLGTLDAGERAAVLAELGARLQVGAVALVELRGPQRPERIYPVDETVAEVGALRYRVITEGWPVDTELMRWRVEYLTLDGEVVIVEDVAEFSYRHPSPLTVCAEAAAVGLQATRMGTTEFWVLRKT